MKGKPIKWPDECVDFVRAWCPFFLDKELAAFLSADWDMDIDRRILNAFRLRKGIKTGRTGYFHTAENPGYVPPKGSHLSPATEFKKGMKPHNTAPVGTKVKDAGGYWKQKIAEPDKWEYIHRMIWEEAHGKLDRQVPVVFLNQNKDDLRLENLMAITRGDLVTLNHTMKLSTDAEINKTMIITAKLKSAIFGATTHVSGKK